MASRLHRQSIAASSGLLAGLWLLFAGVSAATDTFNTEFPQAKPDLVWKRAPFSPVSDPDARYVDYASGRDTNPGTRDQPWKHHPWDPRASARATQAKGIATYYFKKGVIYHGSLLADKSGTSDRPIRLTIDPAWGTGEAVLAGSQPVQGRWRICDGADNQVLPKNSRNLTWCIDTDLQHPPRGLWLNRNDGLTRITLARTPNWTVSNRNDPRSEWYEFSDVQLELTLKVRSTSGFAVGDSAFPDSSRQHPGRITRVEAGKLTLVVPVSGYRNYAGAKQISSKHATTELEPTANDTPPLHRLIDPANLNTPTGSSYAGAALWVEPHRLPIPIATTISGHDPGQSALTARILLGPEAGPVPKSRYFLEGLPEFLDKPGEYAYKRLKQARIRLFLRLPGDQDPNKAGDIEAAAHHTLLRINNKQHIEVSGLRLRSSNQIDPDSNEAREAPLHASAIQIRGLSSHIDIHHCDFDNLPAGVIGYPADDAKQSILDHIEISDNTFRHIDGAAIALGNGQRRKKFAATSSRLVNVDILRNQLHDIGLLALGQRGAIGVNGNGIFVHGGEIVEIAFNDVRRVGGSGINLLLGSEYSKGQIDRPLLHGRVHHNKVIDSVLAGYDFGGISAWTGGPVYIYNNIVGNPVGYLHSAPRWTAGSGTLQRSSYAAGIYLDGVYKAYVFNNIVWGLDNDLSRPVYNAAAYNEAAGFMHMVFHNTLYKFAAGLHRGGGIQHNRNYYLGNLVVDMSHKFIQHKTRTDSIEYPTLAFSNNVFQGKPDSFGQLGKGVAAQKDLSLADWQALLSEKAALEHATGIITASDVVVSAQHHDFRLRPGSAAIGKGVRVFAPWTLSRVVGEWHFYRSRTQPAIVMGENINMNAEWAERMMFHKVPRNDLECPNTGSADFVNGILENWTSGALVFDGVERYCTLTHEKLTTGRNWEVRKGRKSISGGIEAAARDTVDMHENSFLIETVLAVDSGATGGGIIGKRHDAGYEAIVSDQGHLRLTLDFGKTEISRTSAIPVNDGKWHHVVIEVDRNRENGADIWIDGKLSNGAWSGPSRLSGSLANPGDLEIGRSSGKRYFKGQIDFLRVSKGTLREAATTLEELREWQFNGPFLRDFSGSPARHNAGAVETVRQ